MSAESDAQTCHTDATGLQKMTNWNGDMHPSTKLTGLGGVVDTTSARAPPAAGTEEAFRWRLGGWLVGLIHPTIRTRGGVDRFEVSSGYMNDK